MEHKNFQKAISAERKYVGEQLKLWEAALKEATDKVAYWKRQDDMISGVSARVNLGDDSAFKGGM